MERFLPEKLPNCGDTWVWSSSKYLTSENVKEEGEKDKKTSCDFTRVYFT